MEDSCQDRLSLTKKTVKRLHKQGKASMTESCIHFLITGPVRYSGGDGRNRMPGREME